MSQDNQQLLHSLSSLGDLIVVEPELGNNNDGFNSSIESSDIILPPALPREANGEEEEEDEETIHSFLSFQPQQIDDDDMMDMIPNLLSPHEEQPPETPETIHSQQEQQFQQLSSQVLFGEIMTMESSSSFPFPKSASELPRGRQLVRSKSSELLIESRGFVHVGRLMTAPSPSTPNKNNEEKNVNNGKKRDTKKRGFLFLLVAVALLLPFSMWLAKFSFKYFGFAAWDNATHQVSNNGTSNNVSQQNETLHISPFIEGVEFINETVPTSMDLGRTTRPITFWNQDNQDGPDGTMSSSSCVARKRTYSSLQIVKIILGIAATALVFIASNSRFYQHISKSLSRFFNKIKINKNKSAEKSYKYMTVKQLQQQCRLRLLSPTGIKKDLIYKLRSHDGLLGPQEVRPSRDISQYRKLWKKIEMKAVLRVLYQEPTTGTADDIAYRLLRAREADYNKMTRQALRPLLLENGLPVSGPKSEMARRIAEAALAPNSLVDLHLQQQQRRSVSHAREI